MSFPKFYAANRVGKLYVPDTLTATQAGARARLSPSSQDKRRVMLLLVDAQVDFVFTDGALSVPGAVEDTKRTVEFIYHNAGAITSIAASLDSHLPYQIFFSPWWGNERGEHPAPFTPISSADIKGGIWRPLVDPAWSVKYVAELEKTDKQVLMIWPFHTMIGTPGHSLVPALYEAVVFHAAARHTQPTILVKGSIPQTENYSIVEPEVKYPRHPLGGLNTSFLDMLAAYDLVYVAGQAKSHCVLETMKSMMRYFAQSPDVIAKVRFLMDCTSSVQHPQINFEAIAMAKLREMEQQGVRLVLSTDPIR